MLPEELELARLEAEQAELEEELATAELQLETLKIELAQFHYRYHTTVSPLFVELDQWDLKISLVEAGQHPDDVEAQFRAKAAEEQARRSAEEASNFDKKPPPPEITPEIKQAYRQAAKLMHPDRASNDAERERRTVIMAQVNRAYESGDLSAIERLIADFGQDPEAITGDDIGSHMIKTIRRNAQLRRRLPEVEKGIIELQKHELFELMTIVNETEAMGGDPLGDMVQDLMRQISERKIRLEMLRQAADESIEI
jgi:hypothetical protein